MFKLIRRLFRWALYLVILAVVLAVAAVLLLNTVAKQILQNRLRSETGLEVAIGKVDIGLGTPTISIEDLRVYNTPEFGGSLFLDVPEIFADYDRDALRARKLHLNLLRLNLAEVDIIKDKKGRSNVDGLAQQKKAVLAAVTNSTASGLAFGGIDTLNITFQKMCIGTLDNSRPEEVNFGLTNQIFHNLNSNDDFRGMGMVLAARGSAASGASPSTDLEVQKILQQLLR